VSNSNPKDSREISNDRIVLDGMNAIQFNLFVDLLAEWILNGNVKVRILPESRPVFEFEENKLFPILKNNNLPEQCIGQLKMDIPFMLYGILTGRRGLIAAFLTNNANSRQPKGVKAPTQKNIQNEVKSRLEYIEQKIVTSDFRRQYVIKSRAKTSVYYGISWEVVRSQSENDITFPVGLTYSTVRIDTLLPSLRQKTDPFFNPFVVPDPTEFESVILTMTLQDLTSLIESLNNAARAIKQSIDSEGK
jgi:hypothetical protein